EEAFEKPMTTEGQGGSIPLCNVLAETFPEAEIFLMGVEEPKCLIHAPNESVDPSEIEHLALAEALFLEKYAVAAREPPAPGVRPGARARAEPRRHRRQRDAGEAQRGRGGERRGGRARDRAADRADDLVRAHGVGDDRVDPAGLGRAAA